MDYTKKMLAVMMSFSMLSAVACGDAETANEPQSDSSASVTDSVAEQSSEAEESAADTSGETDKAEDSVSDDSNDETDQADESPVSEADADTEGKILIAYFSNPQTDGTDADSSASRTVDNGVVMGNVEYTASLIQQQTGGDLFRIETVQAYPADYRDTTDQAKDEQNANARPELANHLDDVSQYDTVYIGFPNWWGDMPMALYSFFDEYDFSGAEIHVFVLHGGSGASRTVSSIQSLEPNAAVNENALTLYWSDISNAESLVTDWLN